VEKPLCVSHNFSVTFAALGYDTGAIFEIPSSPITSSATIVPTAAAEE